MLCRHPEAIIAAHMMDHSRRELYVEGQRDRIFLSWLLAEDQDPNALVLEIAFVDLPDQGSGGERGRLIRFAEWLSARQIQIRCFADADWDRLLGRSVPDRVWLTDHRDLEGYVLRLECVDKVLRLGICTDRITPAALLGLIKEHGRTLGLIRVMSELDSLSLPFQATKLKRHLHAVSGCIQLQTDNYLRALLQNARTTLLRLDKIKERLKQLEGAYASTPDSQMIHGKDALCLVEAALSSCGVGSEEGTRLLWTSFERSFVENGSTLQAVADYLRPSRGAISAEGSAVV